MRFATDYVLFHAPGGECDEDDVSRRKAIAQLRVAGHFCNSQRRRYFAAGDTGLPLPAHAAGPLLEAATRRGALAGRRSADGLHEYLVDGTHDTERLPEVRNAPAAYGFRFRHT